MTASPPLNGHARPTLPVLGDWRPATPEPAEEQRNPEPQPAETSELVAQAQAEAIRAQAWADAEAQRIAAETKKEADLKLADAEADAIRTKAAEAARRMKLANDKQERQAREDDAASAARIAESNRLRADAERAQADETRQAAEEKLAEQEAANEIKAADEKWRAYAIRFAIVCGIVSLPVQMSFFWNPQAPWMAAAPVMLEGAAWVVHRGARAAAVSKRPVWHYRAIVWFLAFVAAGVNLYHGLHSFDPGTALATAFASVAGPGVWDLHEHGRIRKRDGVPTRRERKAAEKTEKEEARRKAAEEQKRAAEKEAADKAAEEARMQLADDRQREFEDVWKEAAKIAAAVGSTTDDDAVWVRAYRNIKGCDPGESIESITARRAAEKRVEAALTGTPVNTVSKGRSSQVDQQMPRPSRRGHAGGPTVRGTRQKGDTQKYSAGARRQAAITAKTATEKKGREGR